jgi:predicted molibdopterin-dependent oxidoreductase YjgC
MGVCFECVVQIDGLANVPSCMVATRAGMAVELQSGARRVESAT